MGFGEIFAQHSTQWIAQLGRELHVCIPTLSNSLVGIGLGGIENRFGGVAFGWLEKCGHLYSGCIKASNVANRISMKNISTNILTFFIQLFPGFVQI